MGHINISKNHHKLILVSLAVLFIAMYVVIFKSVKIRNNNDLNSHLNIYQSDFMSVKFEAPNAYQISDDNSVITINTDHGSITLTLNNTNYENLEEYLTEYNEKRNIINTSDTQYLDKEHDSARRIFLIGENEQKSYFYYRNFQIFIFSTSSPELYDELDQIAASFEYLGDTEN